MKKICLSILMSLAAITLLAQTQQGVSYRYNGKHPRTPLGNVTISYDGNQRTTLSKENSGEFTLTLTGRKMGDRIGLVTVKKRDMMVFNKQAVDEWSVRKEPLQLILCDADEFENQKQKLIEIGFRQAKERYDRQKALLEIELAESKIKQQEYESAIDAAHEELEKARKHMAEYADLFARIDESEIDPQAQQAMDLFHQGNVEQAIQLFEQGNYMEKLKQDNRSIQQADQLIQMTEEAKAKALQDRETHLKSLKAQIDAYKIKNDWEKVGDFLKEVADEMNTYEEIYDYLNYCMSQLNYEEAELYTQKLWNLVNTVSKEDEDEFFFKHGCVRAFLGSIYINTDRKQEGERLLLEALSYLKKITNTQASSFMLASISPMLGFSYNETGRYRDGERMFKEALTLLKKIKTNELQSSSFSVQQIDGGKNLMITACMVGLANSYKKTQKYTECEKTLTEAIQYMESQNDLMNEKNLKALTYSNLAELYKTMLRTNDSETYYKKAIAIYRELVKINPQANEGFLAGSLIDLADLYIQSPRINEGLELVQESISLCRSSKKTHSAAVKHQLANGLFLLGNIKGTNNSYADAEAAFKEALEIEQELVTNNSQKYNPLLSDIANNLGFLYLSMQRLEDADRLLMMALHLREQIAKEQKKDLPLAITLYNVALMKASLNQYEIAVGYIEKAHDIYLREVKTNPMTKPQYIQATVTMGQIHIDNKNFPKAYKTNEEVIPILLEQHQQNPTLFQTQFILSVVGNQSFVSLFVGEFAKAEQYAHQVLRIDPSQHFAYTNLAASLLFQGKYAEAEKIYLQYKEELKDGFLDDFKQFAEAGIIPKEYEADVEKIKRMLNE